MAGNGNAAAEIGQILLRDYLDDPGNSAVCRYLEWVEEFPTPYGIQLRIARRLFCPPPSPPDPPTENFFNAGGTPCRLYRVVYESGVVGQPPSQTQLDRRGPIGRIQREVPQPDGKVGRVITLTSGTGIGCPRVFDQMAGTNDVSIQDVFARIISITPLEGDPATEEPVARDPLDQPPSPPPDFEFEVNFEVDGIEVNAPFTFGLPVGTNNGPVIPFTFAPTANFNPQIDISIGANPTFGLDVDLEFVIPLGGPTNAPQPLPGAEPVPLPDFPPALPRECEEFDYERIESAIENAKCCAPINDITSVGTFTFETPNQVFTLSVPDDTIAVFLGVIPGENTRIYKMAGASAEYGHGNAALLVSGNALGFERIYVNNHALFFPEETTNKGVRLSMVQGTVVQVNVGRNVVEEE